VIDISTKYCHFPPLVHISRGQADLVEVCGLSLSLPIPMRGERTVNRTLSHVMLLLVTSGGFPHKPALHYTVFRALNRWDEHAQQQARALRLLPTCRLRFRGFRRRLHQTLSATCHRSRGRWRSSILKAFGITAPRLSSWSGSSKSTCWVVVSWSATASTPTARHTTRPQPSTYPSGCDGRRSTKDPHASRSL